MANTNKKSKQLAEPVFSRPLLIIFALIFATIGGYAIYRSFAAGGTILGDTNSDGQVSLTDLTNLLANWHTNNANCDFNSDGTVDGIDLSILLTHYGQTTTQQLPATPTGLVVTPADGSVNLSWNANSSSDQVDTYQVYITTDSTWATWNTVLSVNGANYTVPSLTNGTTYYFRVSGHNSVGYGNWTAALAATPQGAAGGGSGSGSGIGALRYNGITSFSNLSQYHTLLFNENDSATACNYSNPVRLDYQSGTDVPNSYSDGVDWNTANSNGWLLKDSGGSLMLNQSYPGIYIGDVGSSSYQQAWINSVSSLLTANHCNGVFIDDVVRDIKGLTGQYPAKYPSQSAWQAAMASFINAVGPALKARGFYVAINAVGYTSGSSTSDDGTDDVQWFQQLGPSVNGLMEESWQETAEGSNTIRATGTSSWTQYWDGWQRLVSVTQNMGDDFIGVMYGDSSQYMRYGKGSFLLDWNGGGSVFMYANGSPNGSDPWDLNWTTNIGAPTAPKTNPQPGVWERTYTGGIVIVNTNTSSVTIAGHTIPATDAYIGP